MEREMNKILICLYEKNDKDFSRTYEAIKRKDRVSDDELSTISIDNKITLIDSNYPASLKNTRPIFVLYTKGLFVPKKRVFVLGSKPFNMDDDLIVRITENNTVKVGNQFEVWSNTEKINDAINIALAYSNNYLLITKGYNEKDARTIVVQALSYSADIGVMPSNNPSFGNKLIKDGAYLVDSIDDLSEVIE